MSRFKEHKDEVSFILNSMDLDDSLGPLQDADYCGNLRDVKIITRRLSCWVPSPGTMGA